MKLSDALFVLPRRAVFVAGFVVYGLAAWFSEGYHHPDEHFQVLEFAHYIAGKTAAADLPWEFQERIRPGLQPVLAYGFIRLWRFAGLENPFVHAFLLRLLSGLFIWCLFWAWARRLGWDSGGRHLAWMGLALWFMPYLGVRFSSENWSALAFWSGVLLLGDGKERAGFRMWASGFLLTISFLFRFQMAFALLGLGAWLLRYRHFQARHWFLLLGGALTAAALGLYCDYQLYGGFEPVALAYFKANILENKAAHWGTEPWWYYVEVFVVSGIPPLSLLLLFWAFRGARTDPGRVFIWVFVPFFLAHSLIGHKELRFLFPMVLPLLGLAATAWAEAPERLTRNKWLRAWVIFSLCINTPVWLLRNATPANEAMPALRYIYTASKQQGRTLWAIGEDPYRLVGLPIRFYLPENLQVHVVKNIQEVRDFRSGDLLLLKRGTLQTIPEHGSAQLAYSLFPDWLLRYDFNNWQSRSNIWRIYVLEPD